MTQLLYTMEKAVMAVCIDSEHHWCNCRKQSKHLFSGDSGLKFNYTQSSKNKFEKEKKNKCESDLFYDQFPTFYCNCLVFLSMLLCCWEVSQFFYVLIPEKKTKKNLGIFHQLII